MSCLARALTSHARHTAVRDKQSCPDRIAVLDTQRWYDNRAVKNRGKRKEF